MSAIVIHVCRIKEAENFLQKNFSGMQQRDASPEPQEKLFVRLTTPRSDGT